MVEKDNIGQTGEVTEQEVKPEVETQAVETEKREEKAEKTESGSLGKFKSPDALYAAYIGLEAEYTKKCQKLKELEKLCSDRAAAVRSEAEETEIKPSEKDNFVSPESAPSDGKEERTFASDKAEEERIIREYLSTVAKKKIPLMGRGGSIVTSEKRRPRTIKEAGSLALQYLREKNV